MPPLLGTTSYKEYEVTLKDGDDIITEYVVAKDAEHAAWAALELTIHRDAKLNNVRQTDEW